jgi:hypothetical protein
LAEDDYHANNHTIADDYDGTAYHDDYHADDYHADDYYATAYQHDYHATHHDDDDAAASDASIGGRHDEQSLQKLR